MIHLWTRVSYQVLEEHVTKWVKDLLEDLTRSPCKNKGKAEEKVSYRDP